MIILLLFNLIFLKPDSMLVKENEIGGFQNAVSLTTDAKEKIYVLDAGSNQIIKFNNRLEYLKRNGKQGWAEGQFDSPTFIDGSSGLDIFVSDAKNQRVQRLDLELNPITSLKTNLPDFSPDFQYNTPVATLILNSTELYVVDGDNHRIVVYKDGRNPSNIFGDYKSGRGQLARPVKILKDEKNFIYVLDKELGSVIRFDNLGNYVSTITVDSLQTFAIKGSTLYLFDGKKIILYDLEKSSIVEKKIFPLEEQKKFYRDILVLSNEKYLLLEKNALSLWREIK